MLGFHDVIFFFVRATLKGLHLISARMGLWADWDFVMCCDVCVLCTYEKGGCDTELRCVELCCFVLFCCVVLHV